MRVAAPLTVLLVHGLCSTPEELFPVQSALRRAGFDVRPLTIEGYSFEAHDGPQRWTRESTWTQAVADEVDALNRQSRAVVLVGLSAGATVALGAAMQTSAPLAGLVLMSTPLRMDGWAVPWYQFLLPLALYTPAGRFWQYRERPPYGVKNERVRSWIEHQLTQRKVSTAGAAVIGVDHLREHDRLRRRVRQGLGRVRATHVLVMHAREDEVASLSNVKLLQEGLVSAAPLSLRTLILDHSYHMITIDNDRPQVVQETLQFVNIVLSASTAAPQ
jgi:carboxylesterase